MVLASMAVCEFEEPCTVTKDSTFSLSSCTVSLGAKSSATIITDSSNELLISSILARLRIILSDIHLTLLLSYNHHP